MKKPANKGNEAKTQEYGKVETFTVEHARLKNDIAWFTLVLNGVTINNCRVVEMEGKDDFISLPAYKGSDGKYYSTVYFRFSPEDTKSIIELVEKMLEQ